MPNHDQSVYCISNTVLVFCDNSTRKRNSRASKDEAQHCSHHVAWDVVRESEDFKGLQSSASTLPATTAFTEVEMQHITETSLVFVFDIGDMTKVQTNVSCSA
ncbi:uncharacterized protein LOC142584140 [Dermacentor variabilis]|uniref:uncharacterized protein LOC142584140 n=1 Tax=Dermacentor variabilis TaxID=34621 RepID=UPI003F5C0CB7